MTGRQVIWITIVFIVIGMTWSDPQPDNDMDLGADGYIQMVGIQSGMNTIEHVTAAALVDLSRGSRAPPRAPAEPIYRVVLLSLPPPSLLGGSFLDATTAKTQKES